MEEDQKQENQARKKQIPEKNKNIFFSNIDNSKFFEDLEKF